MQEKYINPFTDFGFKKIFGEEANKDLLMDFLNELLPDQMDFIFDEAPADKNKLRHDIQLMDIETHRIFFPKLRFIYLEMPKFSKSIDELETRYEKWLYVLKNLARLEEIPARLQERIFTKLFQVAELAQFNETDRWAYQDSLKHYRDLKNVTDTATEEGYLEGKAEGLAEGKAEGESKANREMALNAIRQGLTNVLISALTGLTESEIEQLRDLR